MLVVFFEQVKEYVFLTTPFLAATEGIKKNEKFLKKNKISGTLWNLLEPWGHIGESPWGGV